MQLLVLSWYVVYFVFPSSGEVKSRKKKCHHARELGKKAVEVPYMAHAGGEAESWRSRERERRREIVSHTGCVWLLYQGLKNSHNDHKRIPTGACARRR